MQQFIKKAGQVIKHVVSRFPLAVLVSLAWTVVTLVLLYKVGDKNFDIFSTDFFSPYAALFLTLILAFPVSILASLITEHTRSISKKVSVYLVTLLLLAVYHFAEVENFLKSPQGFDLYSILCVVSVLAICAVPYFSFRKRTAIESWVYYKKLAIALLKTVTYTSILNLGLTLLLVLIGSLFDVDIPAKVWYHMFAYIAGIYAPFMFLSSFPSLAPYTISETEGDTVEIKIFSRYVLMPLLVLYTIILYIYAGTIVFTAVWPKGIVTTAVLSVSLLGIFSYVLAYPYFVRRNIVKKASYIYFGLLIPLLFVAYSAIWIRVSEYGITEGRYLVLLATSWVFYVSAYFLISAKKNINVIPFSAAVLLLLSSCGPWGIFSVSAASQAGRLEQLLQKNGLISGSGAETKIVTSPSIVKNVSYKDRVEIGNLVDYLYTEHALHSPSWLYNTVVNKFGPMSCVNREYTLCTNTDEIVGLFGLTYEVYASAVNDSAEYVAQKEKNIVYQLSTEAEQGEGATKVSGYDYLMYTYSEGVLINGDKYRIAIDTYNNNDESTKEKTTPFAQVLIRKNGDVVAQFPLKPLLEKLHDAYKNDQYDNFKLRTKDLRYVFENAQYKVSVDFTRIEVPKNDPTSGKNVEAYASTILFSVKK